jgi:hypothetical protein
MKIQNLIGKQTLMKSNAQLRRDDSDDDVPVAMLVGFPDMASSSQTVPPSKPEVNWQLFSDNGGSSCHSGRDEYHAALYVSMQQSITTMQQEVHSINLRVEQNQLDLRECLKFHHPASSDEDDAPRTTPMAEDVWLSFCLVASFFCVFETFGLFFAMFVKLLD